MSSFLTSNSLITSVKNRALIPTNQQTFSTDDFLRFANEEMYNGLVPLLIQVHEEFLLKQEAVSIDGSTTVFDIPYRAVGNKLRDLSILDGNQNYYSLSRISPDALDNYPGHGSSVATSGFYLLDNTVNLMSSSYPIIGSSKLIFTFYMRPNSLVKEERISKISSVTKVAALSFTGPDVDLINNHVTITNHGLSNGVSGVIGAGTPPAPLQAGGKYFVKAVDSNTLQFFNDADLTQVVVLTTQAAGSFAPNCYDLAFSTPSTVFSSSDQYDIVQYRSPHKISHYDLDPVQLTAGGIRFKEESFAYPIGKSDGSPRIELPKKNDLVSLAGETLVPQIPDELHPILAQRVACRCLEALGDREGLGAANAKLAEMIQLAMPMINDRAEGNPQKVVNFNSPLRGRLSGSRTWRR